MQAQFEEAQRTLSLINTMYLIIRACELAGTPIVYQAIRDTMMQHCTEGELNRVCDELARYNRTVEKMKTRP